MAINDAAIRRPLSIVGDIRGARLGQDGSGDARRQSERELWRQFELARPRILGALLDLGYAQFGLDRVPRMADSALCDGVRNGHRRRRLGRRPRADHGPSPAVCLIGAAKGSGDQRAELVDGQCRRPSAGRRQRWQRRRCPGQYRLVQKPPCSRWPPASGADVFAGIGHRDYVQSRRPSWKQGHPDACY